MRDVMKLNSHCMNLSWRHVTRRDSVNCCIVSHLYSALRIIFAANASLLQQTSQLQPSPALPRHGGVAHGGPRHGGPHRGGVAAAHGEVLPGESAVHPDAAAPPSHVLSLRNGDKDPRGTKVTKLTKLTRKRRNMKKLMGKVKSPWHPE